MELSRDGKYRIKKEMKKHWLIINEATKEDMGTYYVYTSGGESKGELEVEGISNIICLISNRNVTMHIYFAFEGFFFLSFDCFSWSYKGV